MKRLGLFSLALLAGCVPTQKEYTIIRETSRPAVEETQPVTEKAAVKTETTVTQTPSVATPTVETQTACGGMPCMQPAPTYYAGTYNRPQGMYQSEQHIAYQSGGCGGQVMCGQNLAATLGGSVMNMPAAQMMGAAPVQPLPMPVQMTAQPTMPQVQTTTIQVPVQIPVNGQMIQTQTFYETQMMPDMVSAQTNAQMPVTEQMSVVILQHPVNRDLVKCSFADMNCVSAYEAQGYVQLRGASDFSAYNAVSTNTWQNNNNIPRW